MRARWSLGIGLVLALGGTASVASGGTFTSGSTGADGAFTASCGTPPCTQSVQLPASGVFNYTTYTIPTSVTVKYLRNATNTPVTILTTLDVTIAGTLDVSGSAGGAGLTATVTASNGGAGGPGGRDGGSGGTKVPVPLSPYLTRGGQGLGPGGARGGAVQNQWCAGGGGGFGGAGAAGAYATGGNCDPTFQGTGVGGPAYGQPSLLPLVGGSGGGGGSGELPHSGAGGGGGAGTILIASSGTINLNGGTILASGGAGGPRATAVGSKSGNGGGGSGGGVRLIATTITTSPGTGTITVNGGAAGNGAGDFLGGAGGAGRIRIEAYTLSANIVFSTTPSITQPGSVTLTGNPTLTITSLAGITVPASPGGKLGAPDVTLPNTTTSPIAVGLSATNIPAGASLKLQVTPQMGDRPAALTGTLSGTTYTFSGVTIPVDQPFRVDAEASFNLTAWVDSPIKYAGEEVTTVMVVASLGSGAGTGTRTHLRYYTASGKEVPEVAVAALGLPR